MICSRNTTQQEKDPEKRHPRRGTHRTLPPQPGPVPPPRHRRARPAAVDRAVQDRRRTAPRHRPRTRRRPVRRSSPASAAPTATVPLAAAYDTHERTWNPPMPLLFQRLDGLEDRPIAIGSIRDLLTDALAAAGITGTDGKPLDLQAPRLPQDLHHRRDPQRHAARTSPSSSSATQDINTTMGYKAVYPQEAISGHRAFIARRRAAPPQRGVPLTHRRRMGRVPRPLRAPPRRTRRLRTRLLHQLHPRALLLL